MYDFCFLPVAADFEEHGNDPVGRDPEDIDLSDSLIRLSMDIFLKIPKDGEEVNPLLLHHVSAMFLDVDRPCAEAE